MFGGVLIFVLTHLFPILIECPEHHYICDNSTCVPETKWCDGVNDCDDQTDEVDYCKGKLYSCCYNDVVSKKYNNKHSVSYNIISLL